MKNLTLAIILIISSENCFGWSADGHRVIAMIALKYLDTHGKGNVSKKVRDITAGIVPAYFNSPQEQKDLLQCDEGQTKTECLSYRSAAAAAIFPDQVKHTEPFMGTASWHFINTDYQTYNLNFALQPKQDEYTKRTEVIGDLNIMIKGLTQYLKTYDPKTKTGDLGIAKQIPAALEWASSCKTRNYDCQTEALSFLIHLVGDIHQPLHVSSACDEGGNKVSVTIFSQPKDAKDHPYELHAAWDENLFTTSPNTSVNGGKNIVAVVNDMALMGASIAKGAQLFPTGASTWSSQTDPELWANESLSFAPDVYTFTGAHSFPVAKLNSTRKVADVTWISDKRCPTHPNVPDLGEAYRTFAVPLMETRLLQGGTRLAALLSFIYN